MSRAQLLPIGAGLAAALLHLSVTLTSVLPVMMVVYFALQNRTTEDGTVEWYPVGRILTWLTALGFGTLVVATMIFAGTEAGLEGAIRGYLDAALSGVGGMDPAAVDRHKRDDCRNRTFFLYRARGSA